MIRLKSRVGPKGQAVIPKPVRDEAGISPGDEVYFRIQDGVVIVEKKGGAAILEEYLEVVKEKRQAPKRIDWDRIHTSQFRFRGR